MEIKLKKVLKNLIINKKLKMKNNLIIIKSHFLKLKMIYIIREIFVIKILKNFLIFIFK